MGSDQRPEQNEDLNNEEYLHRALAEQRHNNRIIHRAERPSTSNTQTTTTNYMMSETPVQAFAGDLYSNYPSSSNSPPQPPRLFNFGGQFNGSLRSRPVPADNSCLFSSIRFVLSDKIEPKSNAMLRRIVAQCIANDTVNYSDAILGRSNASYCAWIQQPNAWGGAIEVSIFSNYYRIEIDVVDLRNGIINRFGEDKNYGLRVFIQFDGAHYDPLYMPLDSTAEPATIFPITEMGVYQQAEQLARDGKAMCERYKHVPNYRFSCADCDQMFETLTEAKQHASKTGHANFKETQN